MIQKRLLATILLGLLQMQDKKKWNCRVCGSGAYEKHGGHNEPAYRVQTDEDGTETRTPIIFRRGQHFRCKGCSVFFSNPRRFNKNEQQ